MPLRNFNKRSGVARVAEELKANARHKKYLETFPLPQLEKLIQIIQDHMNGIGLKDSLKKNKDMDTISPNEDLNRVDAGTLARKKAIMEQAFEAHRKKPGDKDFQYDVEVDFEGGIESCEWDSASDDEFWGKKVT